MKKVILAASAIAIGAAAFAQTGNGKSDLEFQKYIAKKITYNTNFAKEDVQGTIKVKVDMTPEGGVENVNIIAGINPKIDSEVISIIKKTPSKVTSKYASDKAVSMVVPVRLVLKDN